jgi:hypothetical protein
VSGLFFISTSIRTNGLDPLRHLLEIIFAACLLGISRFWVILGLDSQGSGIRDQGSGIRDQGSGIRDQGSGIRDQKKATWFRLKGASGMGGACGTGVLRCAQDDGNNKQR